jgi:ERF superfamily
MENTSPVSSPLIFKALIDCTKDIGLTGISKDGVNTYQRFNYRSIDDCLAAFNKVFAKNGICTTQRTLNTVFENLGKDTKGAQVWGITFDLEVIFYAEDGSSLTSTISMANDGKDRSKLVGQATSYALKELLFKQFVVPVEGADDIDSRDEEGRPTSVLPQNGQLTLVGKPDKACPRSRNKQGIAWIKPDLAKGMDATVAWATTMTGLPQADVRAILETVKPDAKGKKASNFLAHIEAIWASN